MDRFKKLYDYLLDSGELKKIFPRAKGTWEEDEKMFVKTQKELEELANIKDAEDYDK